LSIKNFSRFASQIPLNYCWRSRCSLRVSKRTATAKCDHGVHHGVAPPCGRRTHDDATKHRHQYVACCAHELQSFSVNQRHDSWAMKIIVSLAIHIRKIRYLMWNTVLGSVRFSKLLRFS